MILYSFATSESISTKCTNKIPSSIGKGPSETGWSDSYDKELCEFSVLLWFHFQQQLSIKLVIDELKVGEESNDFGTFTVMFSSLMLL